MNVDIAQTQNNKYDFEKEFQKLLKKNRKTA